MKRIYITLQMLFAVTVAFAQNWSYVGAPYLNGHTSSGTYLYFGDMEIDASGNILVGYWEYSGIMSVTKFNGSSWSQLASPGTFPASSVDVEIHGSDYYIAYMGARSGSYYAFVKKFNGSSWAWVGDSVLIGGVGQGGSFDFALDNNGVPTLVGIPKSMYGDKTVKQFTSGTWSNTDTIPGTTAMIFGEGSVTFDASNKLNCYVSSSRMITTPPYSIPFVVGIQVDGTTDTVLGDTIYSQGGPGRFRIDASGNKYMIFNQPLKSVLLAYKLNGSTWQAISDTTGATGTGGMVAGDAGNGKVVYGILSGVPRKSIFMYDAGTRKQFDSVNISGTSVGNMNDVVIRGNDVYILFAEGHALTADYVVMKHSLTGGSSGATDILNEAGDISLYPNPASTWVSIDAGGRHLNSVSVYDLNGKLVLSQDMNQGNTLIGTGSLRQGLYLLHANTAEGVVIKKLLIQ